MRRRLWREHYRALGLREGDIIAWFWIGTHEEYDRFRFGIRSGSFSPAAAGLIQSALLEACGWAFLFVQEKRSTKLEIVRR